MKKNLLLLALAVLAPAAFAKDPSFADFKPLDVVDGYQTYGTPAQDISETFIFVDGGAREYGSQTHRARHRAVGKCG